MKFSRWFGLVLILLFAVAACGNLPTRVVSATLGTEIQGGKVVHPNTIFNPSDRMIHLVVDVENVTGSATVGAKWYSVGPPERLLFESDLQLDPFNTSADFTLTNTNDWIPGSYRVVVLLNGNESRRLNFGITGDTGE